MSDPEAVLVNALLAPDPDADHEMGPGETDLIADENLGESRLLLTRTAVETIPIQGQSGGLVALACTFQPTFGTRFIWARLVLRLLTPGGIRIVDLAPRAAREQEPVQFTIDEKGTIGLNYQVAQLGVDQTIQKQFSTYHCAIQGSGIGTATARWDFNENPHRQDGLGQDQSLLLTLPMTGQFSGWVSVSARLVRPGVEGAFTAIRDMVIGPGERHYPIAFEIPEVPSSQGLARFLRLSS